MYEFRSWCLESWWGPYAIQVNQRGIRSNPESGNHPTTIALLKKVEKLLTQLHTYPKLTMGGRGRARLHDDSLTSKAMVLNAMRCKM